MDLVLVSLCRQWVVSKLRKLSILMFLVHLNGLSSYRFPCRASTGCCVAHHGSKGGSDSGQYANMKDVQDVNVDQAFPKCAKAYMIKVTFGKLSSWEDDDMQGLWI